MTPQVEQFTRELNLSNKTQTYLEKRFGSLVFVNEFNIGFCPASSSYGFDLINGRIIVPIYDVYNNLVAFAGRRMDDYSTDVKNYYKSNTNNFEALQKFLKWKASKWINTPYKKSDHLYNLNNAKKYIFESGFCYVVEGYFDVLHLYSLGIKNVVAICSTNLSDHHCELIYRYCNKIAIMLDGDSCGQIATEKATLRARSKGLFVYIIQLPINSDPDELNIDQLNFINEQIKQSEEELLIKI